MDEKRKNTEEKKENTESEQPHVKLRREMPSWLRSIGHAFRMIFVSPIALIQAFLVRITSGSKGLEKAREQGEAEETQAQVKADYQKLLKSSEDRMNFLLKQYQRDPEYTKEGLSIDKVKLSATNIGHDGVRGAAEVTCQNGTQYLVYLDGNMGILTDRTVPNDVYARLQKLFEAVQLQPTNGTILTDAEILAQDDYLNEMSEKDNASSVPEDSLEYSERHNDIDDMAVDVTRTKNEGSAEIRIRQNGRSHKINVECQDGGVIVMSALPIDCATAGVAQTVYQTFAPLLNAVKQNARNNGQTTEECHRIIQSMAVMNIFKSVKQFASNKTEATPMSMYIIPNGDKAEVITVNGGNVCAYKLSTQDSQNFKFDTVNGTEVAYQASIKVNDDSATIYAKLGNMLYCANGQEQQALQVNKNRMVYTFLNDDHQPVSAVAEMRDGGIAVRTLDSLSVAELQRLTSIAAKDACPNDSFEVYAKAAKFLHNGAALAQQSKQRNYFIIGDTAFSFDGQELSLIQAHDNQPYTVHAPELDVLELERAYNAYQEDLQSRANSDGPEIVDEAR